MKLSDLRKLIKDLPDDTEIILIDPDTSWALVPCVFVDEDGVNITCDSAETWSKPA
jgi:hypothetical protein